MDGIEDITCKNCGFDTFELVDGHYYCVECNEEVENYVRKEVDNFENENVVYDLTRGYKQKNTKKEEERNRSLRESRFTSYEEYNYILRGLVDEILMIESIPNFRKTVLQLWITFLKYTEVAFFEKNVSHLPKFYTFYRHEDAQILYNKKPKAKKKYVNKKRKNAVSEVKEDDNTKEGKRKRKRSSRKSLKKIQKMNEESESAVSSNTSTLSNLTIEDIEATMLGQELRVEFSSHAKNVQQHIKNYRSKRNMDPGVNEDDDAPYGRNRRGTNAPQLWSLILSGHTLLMIIYCALNICGSSIQLCDLLRFTREGHISFHNIRKLLPEKLSEAKLSLQKYHSLTDIKHESALLKMYYFLQHFPDIRKSLMTPNLLILAKRFIEELHLPTCLGHYVERLMDLLPSSMKNCQFPRFPDYEGRAMAYVLFVIKLLFGLDGYREKEISESVEAVNREMKKFSTTRLFNYEQWREYIEYRNVILCKHYFPSVYNDFGHDSQRPYENFVKLLKSVKPTSFFMHYEDDKKNNLSHDYIHRKEMTKNCLQKLLKLHEDEATVDLQFECSLTPLKDALRIILESPLGNTINKQPLHDFSSDSLEYFFEPSKLVTVFEENNMNLSTRQATFPKNYSFQNPSTRPLSNIKQKLIKVTHVEDDERKWIKDVKKEHKASIKEEKNKKIKYHQKQFNKVIKNRVALRRLMINKNVLSLADLNFDEIVTSREDTIDEETQESEEQLTFIHPDFNLWHRSILFRNDIPWYRENVNKLPDSFLWLLNVASRIINHDPEMVYRQLDLIEQGFAEFYKPLEETDNRLEVTKKVIKYGEGFKRYKSKF